jgi:hypothetical protein
VVVADGVKLLTRLLRNAIDATIFSRHNHPKSMLPEQSSS